MAYNEKQKEYTMRYLDKLKQIRFRVTYEEYDRYKEAVEKSGYPSLTQFCKDAIEEKIERIGKDKGE